MASRTLVKKDDVILYENQKFVVVEILPNGNIGAMRLSDEEMYVLRPNEVVMVQKYVKQTKSFKQHVLEFFKWMFSKKFDKWITGMFFIFIKYIAIFCISLVLSLPFILLL